MFQLKPATLDDLDRVYKWRNDPYIVNLSSTRKKVSREQHFKWFAHTVTSLICHKLFIVEPDMGIVRLDRTAPQQAEISVYLLQEYTGKGVGPEVIKQACQHAFKWGITEVVADIRQENTVSIKAFRKAEFTEGEPMKENHRRLVYYGGT